MKYDNVKFGEECRKKIIEGVNLAVDAISVTFGPQGQNSIINQLGSIKITKDGYHTVMTIKDSDPYVMIGVKLIQELCKKTVKDVGDGSSTVSILAREIVNRFLDHKDPVYIIRELQNECKLIVDWLDEIKDLVETKEDLVKVATISANNDPVIGNLIADAFDKVGKDGVVTFEESDDVKDRIECSEGFRIDNGYSSTYFINSPKGLCELENVSVYISDTKMEEVKKVITLADEAVRNKKSLLLIAPDFDSEILVFLSANLDLLKSCTVISPNHGNFREIMLKDMRILLGDTMECKKVVISKNNTTFIGCNSDQSKINERVEEIRNIINEGNLPEIDLAFHKKRLANFTSGIATIHVGGYSQVEMKERYDRIEDAVCATQAALEGGILPGGGVVLAKAAEIFRLVPELKEVLKTPQKLLNTESKSFDDMEEMGVIEPYLVTKTVLENAISTGSMILTAGVAIINNDFND